MNILYVTNIFPSTPDHPQGRFIYESIKSLNSKENNIRIIVINSWKPKIASFIKRSWTKYQLNKSSFKNIFSIEIGTYLSIPNNYFKRVSIYFYKKKNIVII